MGNTTDRALLEGQAKLEQKRRERNAVRQLPSTAQSIVETVKNELPSPEDFCEKHSRILVESRFGGEKFCPKCFVDDRAKETKQENHQSYHQDPQIDRRLKNLNIGKYKRATFENFSPTNERARDQFELCRKYAATISARIAAGDSILMHGNPGTGKNHLAAAIIKAAVVAGFVGLHTTARRIGRRLRHCWDTKEDQEHVLQSEFIYPDILVVDEVTDAINPTDTDSLIEIICERYHQEKPTILLANLDLDALNTMLGAHVVDRFYEGNSSVLVFDWESYRRR